MRGYLSFVLAFLSLALLLSLLSMLQAADSVDLSKAIAVSRAYGVLMNMKENVLEAVRLGGEEGFASYDASHSTGSCLHCPDHFCGPLPAGPNGCDAVLCAACFREGEAREAAERGALAKASMLGGCGFDEGFNATLGDVEFEVFLKPSGGAKNGYALDYGRLRRDVAARAWSGALGVAAGGAVPAGTVVSYG